MREFNHFDFELNGIIRAFLRTAVNDFMDSVHHIWCPLSSQEYQDLPDGAETTLTFLPLWPVRKNSYDQYTTSKTRSHEYSEMASRTSMSGQMNKNLTQQFANCVQKNALQNAEAILTY
jgi:hypothetical protein